MNHYFIMKDNKLVFIKLNISDNVNKTKIPRSIITNKGIFDSTLKDVEVKYLDSIHYSIVEDGDGRNSMLKLMELMDTFEDGDIIYPINSDNVDYLKKRGVITQYGDKINVTPLTNIEFINTLGNELLELDVTDEFIEFDIESYLKSKLEINDLLNTRQLLFYRDMPVGYYYSYQNKETIPKKENISMDVPKSRIVLGKNTNTNIYTIHKLKPIAIIDNIYKYWRDKLPYDLYGIMLIDKLTTSSNIHYMNKKQLVFRDTPNRLDSPTGDTLITEIKPAGLAYYAFKTFEFLKDILDSYLEVDNNIVKQSTIDITDLIYTNGDIKHDNGFVIDYNYNVNNESFLIKLVSGLDLPDRNTLKRLVKKSPSIKLIVINEDNLVCRHYVVVDTKEEQILICNHPANLTLLKDK